MFSPSPVLDDGDVAISLPSLAGVAVAFRGRFRVVMFWTIRIAP